MAELGGAYEQAGQSDRAEAMYRRALAVDPEDGDIRIRLGQLLLRRGDRSGAEREAMGALAVQPGRSAALDLIGRVNRAAPAERDR
jgi:Flp pilus assembly protein TadD